MYFVGTQWCTPEGASHRRRPERQEGSHQGSPVSGRGPSERRFSRLPLCVCRLSVPPPRHRFALACLHACACPEDFRARGEALAPLFTAVHNGVPRFPEVARGGTVLVLVRAQGRASLKYRARSPCVLGRYGSGERLLIHGICPNRVPRPPGSAPDTRRNIYTDQAQQPQRTPPVWRGLTWHKQMHHLLGTDTFPADHLESFAYVAIRLKPGFSRFLPPGSAFWYARDGKSQGRRAIRLRPCIECPRKSLCNQCSKWAGAGSPRHPTLLPWSASLPVEDPGYIDVRSTSCGSTRRPTRLGNGTWQFHSHRGKQFIAERVSAGSSHATGTEESFIETPARYYLPLLPEPDWPVSDLLFI
jgi:hypothetical protein